MVFWEPQRSCWDFFLDLLIIQQGTNVYFTDFVPLAASSHPPAWQSASQLIVEVLQASQANAWG